MNGELVERALALIGAVESSYSSAAANGAYLIQRFVNSYPEANITAIKMLDLVLWQTRPNVEPSAGPPAEAHR